VAKRVDPKVDTLRAERTLNPHPESVLDEAFDGSEFLDARDMVQVKYEMVRRVRVDGASVRSVARHARASSTSPSVRPDGQPSTTRTR